MISVIIPAYNSEQTIDSCVMSVLQQNIGNRNIEILVINDGSTDRTGEILDSLKKEQTVLQVYHIPNGGVSHARNYGICHAKGEQLLFLDSDDFLEKNCLEELMKSYENNKADLVAAEIVDECGTSLAAKSWFKAKGSFVALDAASMGTNMMYIRMGSAVGKLYKRSIILDNNIFFDDKIALAEDSIFVHKYMLSCHSIEKNNKAMYVVRNVNENSLSKRYVENIEECIDLQISVMKSVFSMYPSYEKEWYSHTMDVDVSGCTIFAKNLFLAGCPLTLKQKYKELKKYIAINGRLNSIRRMNSENGPKNRIDKFQCTILSTGSIGLIMLFYWSKESIKKLKLKVLKRGNR